jgi:hypothetical protein
VYDVYYEVDIFVGVGLFFGQALPTARAGDDSMSAQFVVNASSFSLANGGVPAEHATGAMTRAAKRVFHTGLLTN